MLSKNPTAILSPSLVKFSETILPPFKSIFDEVVASSLAASQNGLVTGALDLCALDGVLQRSGIPASLAAGIDHASVESNSLALEPKPSFLLDPRIFSKYAGQDLRWFFRALCSMLSRLSSRTESVRTAWSQAFLFVACSASSPYSIRKEATSALSDLYVQSSASAQGGTAVVLETIVQGMWHWLGSLETGNRESAASLAKSGTTALNPVLSSICLSPREYQMRAAALGIFQTLDASRLEGQMCSLLVLAKPALIPQASWIDLCLKVGLDPGKLASKHEQGMIDQIIKHSGDREKVGCQCSYHKSFPTYS